MKKIGMIGCGNMGQAILGGIMSKGLASGKDVFISDIDSVKLEKVRKGYGVEATFNNSMVASSANIIILAVKPQDMEETLLGIAGSLTGDKVLVSIAAGVTIRKISFITGGAVSVARTMPNMPALIKEGFTAVSYSRKTGRREKELIKNIFLALGEVVEVKESDLDAITALSGSGPAYFYFFLEALTKAGTGLGLTRKVAARAAFRTALGSLKLLDESGRDPSRLRRQVTSKGGATQAALTVFRRKGLQGAVTAGLKAARKRSRELSGG